MPKAYKILLITHFLITVGYASSAMLLASSPPKLTLVLKSDVKEVAELLSSNTSYTDYSHTSYKIIQLTRKINTTLVRNGADLLVHFTAPNNQVIVQVSDIQGTLINTTSHINMEAGFYEIPVLPSDNESSLYFVSLIVNQQAYSFQVSFRP